MLTISDKSAVEIVTQSASRFDSLIVIFISLCRSTGSNGRPNRRQSNNQQTRPKFRNKITDDVDNNESVPPPRNIGKNRHTTARPGYK